MQTDVKLSPVIVPQQFTVRVFYGKPSNLWIVLGGILLLGILVKVFACFGLLTILGSDGVVIFCVAVAGLSLFGLLRYLRRQVVDCTATVTADQLTIVAAGAEVLTNVPFAKVITFRCFETKGVHWLIFTMKNGQKIKIAGNSNLGAIGAFVEMVQAVAQVARSQWQHLPGTMKPYRGLF